MPAPLRTRQIARIHILKAALGLDKDRETYEAVLWAQARVESSANLDEHGRQVVIEHMEATLRGIDPKHPALAFRRRPHNINAAHRQGTRKIEALLADAGREWNYAHALATKMYKRDRVEFCAAHQLDGIITALEKDALKRLARELQAIFGEGWIDVTAFYAGWLFGFDTKRRNVEKYTQTMSQVLRWWRGELEASCLWPIQHDTHGGHCIGCFHRARA